MTIRKLPELANITARSAGELVLSPAAVEKFNPALEAVGLAGDAQNVIELFGVIGGGLFEPGPTAGDISARLQRIGEGDVVCLVNSPGGVVTEGAAIYNLFRMHPGNVTMRVIGVAGSMASIVVMAGDRIEIARAGLFFFHNSEGVAEGNRHVMEEALTALSEFDDMMTRVYVARSGLRPADVEKIMDGTNNGGTFMGSDEAIKKGFADSLMPADAVKQGAHAQSPLRASLRLDKALAKSGMSRKERRELMTEVSGKRNAADDAAQLPAGSSEIDAVMARLRNVKV